MKRPKRERYPKTPPTLPEQARATLSLYDTETVAGILKVLGKPRKYIFDTDRNRFILAHIMQGRAILKERGAA